MTTWWWIRHAPTHRRDMIGWTDAAADLSDAARLERLRDVLPGEAPLVSSDLSRAARTADALQGRRPRHTDSPALRELHFGRWEERHVDDLDEGDTALIRRFWEEPGTLRAPAGESWDDLCARVSAFVDSRMRTAPAHIVAVAHMGTILSQVQRATGQSAYETLGHRIDNLSLTRITWDGARWTAEAINHVP